ncbi:MAG: hypothetical protein M1570_11090 [Chloroflexi bacterium]|nr:hypothetical protein [Chloroflexota bacterium]
MDTQKLQLLLMAIDMEDDAKAMEELVRWDRLLRSLGSAPNEGWRRTVVEGLKLRGLPEAPILLAVAEVADGLEHGVSTRATTLLHHLSVSIGRLDLGTLRNGGIAAREFDVQGGPGRIWVENDQVRVTPDRFGAETTRVTVQVRPLPSGVLWTSLKLIGSGETIEVPIIAQWLPDPERVQEAEPDAIEQEVAYLRLSKSGDTDVVEQEVARIRSNRKAGSRERCPKCANGCEPGDRFCAKCGSKL